jgi:hypothetical protein
MLSLIQSGKNSCSSVSPLLRFLLTCKDLIILTVDWFGQFFVIRAVACPGSHFVHWICRVAALLVSCLRILFSHACSPGSVFSGAPGLLICGVGLRGVCACS